MSTACSAKSRGTKICRAISSRRMTKRVLVSAFLLLSSVLLACGKKGPPLAPLNMAPEGPQEIVGRRLGDTVYLQMRVPAKSAAGKGPFSVDHLEVYAVTLAQLTPQMITTPVKEPKHKEPKAKKGAPATPPPPAAAVPPPDVPVVLTRIYVVRGVSKNRNVGPTSPRVRVPLLAAPGRVRAGSTSWNESSVVLNWEPPPSTSDEAPGVLYNVYSAAAAGSGEVGVALTAPLPLNEKPLDAPTFTRTGAPPGKEQ